MLIKINATREQSEGINWSEVKRGICIGTAVGLILVVLSVYWG